MMASDDRDRLTIELRLTLKGNLFGQQRDPLNLIKESISSRLMAIRYFIKIVSIGIRCVCTVKIGCHMAFRHAGQSRIVISYLCMSFLHYSAIQRAYLANYYQGKFLQSIQTWVYSNGSLFQSNYTNWFKLHA